MLESDHSRYCPRAKGRRSSERRSFCLWGDPTFTSELSPWLHCCERFALGIFTARILAVIRVEPAGLLPLSIGVFLRDPSRP